MGDEVYGWNGTESVLDGKSWDSGSLTDNTYYFICMYKLVVLFFKKEELFLSKRSANIRILLKIKASSAQENIWNSN